MAKFFFYAAAAALCALAGSTQAQDATKPPCVPLNFTAKTADIKALNSVIDIAISSGMLKKFIPEPITVKDSAISVVPFSVLGSNFELKPIIKDLAVSGVQTVLPKHLVVSADNGIVLAADFNGTINVDGTIRVQIEQLDRKWYELCWTSPLNPVTCPPAILDIDVSLGVVKPALVANTQLDLVACAPGVPRTVCKDVTVSDILIAALNNKFDTLLPRLLKRFTNVSVLDLTLAFESLSKLNVHFSTSGPLITELGKQLLNFTADEVNKKGVSYKTLIALLQTVFKSVLNNLIKDKLAPGFGNTCYDA